MTLGCAKNQVDTEFMLGTLLDTDYSIVTDPRLADAVVINTCCFIDAAKEETVNTILGMVKLKEARPQLKIIVVGCAAQRYGKELLQEIPEIDAVLGTGQLDRLKEVLDQLQGKELTPPVVISKTPVAPQPVSPRWGAVGPSAYLKIADGCDNHCTYCVIPQIKGHYRSRELPSLVAEARQLVRQGVKELSLVAQDVTAYGLDLYGELRLPELLRALVQIEGLHWVRLLYCYPTYITYELLAVIRQEPKICRYLDLPLQHAAAEVLKKMGRKGDRRFLESLLTKIRSAVPGIALRTTFIVGFPGETEEQFQELLDFMKEQRFQWAGVFTYSQEPDTPAGKMANQIAERVKEERFHRAMLLQREITLELNGQWIGKQVPVMVESFSQEEGRYVGRTQFQAPEVDGVVFFHSAKRHQPGDVVEVIIRAVDEYDLVGEMST
ncbi:MAG: 30S ribosomal protein S12 methylthiotransferase RimO [Clostridia bacterium]|nr:30S ribosomal protein S12 methylthiotransferase RimO [Clostridia bacterium]